MLSRKEGARRNDPDSLKRMQGKQVSASQDFMRQRSNETPDVLLVDITAKPVSAENLEDLGECFKGKQDRSIMNRPIHRHTRLAGR